MASLSAADIRQYVLDYLDLEIDELPTSALNIFMQSGYDEIIGFFDESPTWLHVEYTFTALSGQQEYDLDSFPGLIVPTPLQEISDVRGPRWNLTPVSHRQARAQYRADTPQTGTPTIFSKWGRSLFLWPNLTQSDTYTVTGTRQPIDWIATNSAPDCPQEFHNLIADYTLARAYIQQDDADTGQMMLNAFTPTLHRLATRFYDSNDAQPLVVGGGLQGDNEWRTSKVLAPLIYDWE
jgi:hypothetical protein